MGLKLNLDQPLRTIKDHHPVRIICTDRKFQNNAHPIVGLALLKDTGQEAILHLDDEGREPSATAPIPTVENYDPLFDPFPKHFVTYAENVIENGDPKLELCRLQDKIVKATTAAPIGGEVHKILTS